MPQIPTYDNFHVGASGAPLPGAQLPGGPDASQVAGQQLQQAGQAMGDAGGAAGKIAADMQREANDLRVNDAMNQYMAAQTRARVEVLQLKGKNALERPDGKALPDEYGEKLANTASGIAETLGNAAQKQAFTLATTRQGEQFRGAVSTHMVEQQAVYKKETQKATIDTAVNQGALLWGDAEALAQAKATIGRVVADIAKDHGADEVTRKLMLDESISPLHVGVMKGMITAGMASQAKAYYDENSAGMTLQARAQMQGIVKQASDVQTGEGTADAVWATIGPQGMNDAVKIFDMEKEVRAKLKDNPDAMKHGIDSVRQRAHAFNAQQAETNAAGVNSVYKLIDGGVPLAQVMRSDAWLTLPDVKRHEITKAMDNEAHQREQRAYTAEQRALTRENRGLVQAQRQDAALRLQNADAYLRYSDPDALARMTRTQVEASRTLFGLEGAQHLLQRFDTLQKPGAVAEARIDKQDFEHVAEQMGLDPFNAKSPDKKRQLGELQFRVEQLIDMAQRSKKATLTREEKMGLMTGELARQVKVSGWFSNTDTPVIQLTPNSARDVVVPREDTAKIREALASMRQADPKNPAYAETPDNVRRMYLRKQSRAADLIPDPKP